MARFSGKAITEEVRSGDTRRGQPYRLASLKILDDTMNNVVELTKFLNDGETSPFAGVKSGDLVAYDVKGVRTFQGLVSAEVIMAAPKTAEATA